MSQSTRAYLRENPFTPEQVQQVSRVLQKHMLENGTIEMTADEGAEVLAERGIFPKDVQPAPGFIFRQMLRDGRDQKLPMVAGAEQSGGPRTRWTIRRLADLHIDSREWLEREDNVCREGRLARLGEITEMMPERDYLAFHGGLLSKYLFEEARYCFVYGQFLATVVLSLAFIERALAAIFYMDGQNKVKGTRLVDLAKEALNQGLLTKDEYDWLDEVRKLRNPIVHFRGYGVQPGEKVKDDWWRDNIGSRAVVEGKHPYEILEEDAEKALGLAYRLLGTGFGLIF